MDKAPPLLLGETECRFFGKKNYTYSIEKRVRIAKRNSRRGKVGFVGMRDGYEMWLLPKFE